MIPIVLIHSGNPPYLKFSIRKALQKNKVYLIGDTNPQIDHKNFTFLDMKDYISDDYLKFQKIYKHLSTNNYGFEIFCFLRWFILKDFMLKNEIDVSFYIDSDVMVYVDVNDEYYKFDQYDFTLLHRTAGISSFVTKTGIDNFCNALISIYSDHNSYNFQKIESHFVIRQKHGLGGGVCDMTLLEFYHYHSDIGGGPGKVGEMMTIIDGSTYDHNINAQDQYFKFNGMKEIEMIDGIPYVFSEKLNKKIKFNTLHFNSGAKSLMEKYF